MGRFHWKIRGGGRVAVQPRLGLVVVSQNRSVVEKDLDGAVGAAGEMVFRVFRRLKREPSVAHGA